MNVPRKHHWYDAPPSCLATRSTIEIAQLHQSAWQPSKSANEIIDEKSVKSGPISQELIVASLDIGCDVASRDAVAREQQSSPIEIFRFCSLPAEVRVRIYGFVFAGCRIHKPMTSVMQNRGEEKEKAKRHQSILYVSKGIHVEALPVFWQQVTVGLYAYEVMPSYPIAVYPPTDPDGTKWNENHDDRSRPALERMVRYAENVEICRAAVFAEEGIDDEDNKSDEPMWGMTYYHPHQNGWAWSDHYVWCLFEEYLSLRNLTLDVHLQVEDGEADWCCDEEATMPAWDSQDFTTEDGVDIEYYVDKKKTSKQPTTMLRMIHSNLLGRASTQLALFRRVEDVDFPVYGPDFLVAQIRIRPLEKALPFVFGFKFKTN